MSDRRSCATSAINSGGHAGHSVGWPDRIMSQRASNIERSRWTVEVLDLPADARVLELGYGPGLGVEAALRAAPDGHVVGIDHSSTMRSMATKRNAAAVRSGRATLLVGDAEDPPSALGSFDAIFCCNVWLFWTEPERTIERLGGMLAPSGALAITHLPETCRAPTSCRHRRRRTAHRAADARRRARRDRTVVSRISNPFRRCVSPDIRPDRACVDGSGVSLTPTIWSRTGVRRGTRRERPPLRRAARDARCGRCRERRRVGIEGWWSPIDRRGP